MSVQTFYRQLAHDAALTSDRSHLEPPAYLEPSMHSRRAPVRSFLFAYKNPQQFDLSRFPSVGLVDYEFRMAEIEYRKSRGVFRPNAFEVKNGFAGVPVLVTRALSTMDGTFGTFQRTSAVRQAQALTGDSSC